MKSTGIVRNLDNLGRITLPAEIRKIYKINDKDSIEIFTNGDMIFLKKHEAVCIFCDSSADLIFLNEKSICAKCVKEL